MIAASIEDKKMYIGFELGYFFPQMREYIYFVVVLHQLDHGLCIIILVNKANLVHEVCV